jgi:16S rRNA (cytidine1402-2'-O)-methyltransferase
MPRQGSSSGDSDEGQGGIRDGKRTGSASASRSQVDAERSASAEYSKPSETQLAQITPGLYLVATPIGNARDITLRAIDVLQAADVLACEDTRVTRKLLSVHNIRPDRLVSYHEHNAAEMRPKLIEQLELGKIVALVSDAGTPMINDPGFRMAQDCRELDIPVHAIPGASAVITGLMLAGLPTDRFMYCGFPPPKQGKRTTWLGELKNTDTTLVFLESAKRLAASLTDMADVLGDRDVAVVREMTKKFEETRRGKLSDLSIQYQEEGPPKGEITIVVGPPLEGDEMSDTEIDTMLKDAMKTERIKDAANMVAAASGRSKRDLYNRALALKDSEL